MVLQSQTDLDKRLVRGMGSGGPTPHVFYVEAFLIGFDFSDDLPLLVGEIR